MLTDEELFASSFSRMDYDITDEEFLDVFKRLNYSSRLALFECESISSPYVNIERAHVKFSPKNLYFSISNERFSQIWYEEYTVLPRFKFEPDQHVVYFDSFKLVFPSNWMNYNKAYFAFRYAEIIMKQGYKPQPRQIIKDEKPFYVDNDIRDRFHLSFQQEYSQFATYHGDGRNLLNVRLPTVEFEVRDQYGDTVSKGTANIGVSVGVSSYYLKKVRNHYDSLPGEYYSKEDAWNIIKSVGATDLEAEIVSSSYVAEYKETNKRPYTVDIALPHTMSFFGNPEKRTLIVCNVAHEKTEGMIFVFPTLRDYYVMAESLNAIQDNYLRAFREFERSVPLEIRAPKSRYKVDKTQENNKENSTNGVQRDEDRETRINHLIAKQTICQGKMCGTFRDGIEVLLEGVGPVRIARFDLGNSKPVSQLERIFLDRDIRYVIKEHRKNSAIVHGSCRQIADNAIKQIEIIPRVKINRGSILQGVITHIESEYFYVTVNGESHRVENSLLFNPEKTCVGDVLPFIVDSVIEDSSYARIRSIRQVKSDVAKLYFARVSALKDKEDTDSETKRNMLDYTSALHIQYLQHAVVAEEAIKAAKGFGVPQVLNGAELLAGSIIYFLSDIIYADGEICSEDVSFVAGILGTNVTKLNMIDILNNGELKTLLFSYMNLSDSLIEMNMLKVEKSTTEAFIEFFQLIGQEYLKHYGTRARVEKYNRYMSDVLVEATKRKKEGAKIQFKPISQDIETSQATETKADQNKNSVNSKGQDNLKSALNELNSLVGLQSIKQDVTELLGLLKTMKIREERGLPVIPVSLHLVFTGNPGTGKTTVARILAQLYKEIGVLEKGQLVEVDRSDLVAGYVGQTAIKTQEKIEAAKGGILFIDEAYTLAKEGNDFGQEAIDTILKEMEDHRGEFVVIVAGYSEPMRRFIGSNPGLKSRFNKYFEFSDYNQAELIQIFDTMCAKYAFTLTAEAKNLVAKRIKEMEENKGENFANARDVRNLFEKIITKQANRVAMMVNASNEELTTIERVDVE